MKKKEKLDENGEPIEETEEDMDIGEEGEKVEEEVDFDAMDNDATGV